MAALLILLAVLAVSAAVVGRQWLSLRRARGEWAMHLARLASLRDLPGDPPGVRGPDGVRGHDGVKGAAISPTS